jgi:hypothetical protein
MSPNDLEYVCPKPSAWAAIRDSLAVAAEDRGEPNASPPVPLILGAWWITSDADKARRWRETVRWAAEHGLDRLVDVAEADKYKGSSIKGLDG